MWVNARVCPRDKGDHDTHNIHGLQLSDTCYRVSNTIACLIVVHTLLRNIYSDLTVIRMIMSPVTNRREESTILKDSGQAGDGLLIHHQFHAAVRKYNEPSLRQVAHRITRS
jgi:hypothetical protein